MKEYLIYKRCDLNDLQVLTDISLTTFTHAFEMDNNPEDFKTYIDAAFNLKQIEMELQNSNSRFYFVYMEDEVVGYFKINENDAQAEPFGNDALELSRIYILNKFQGQKLGTQVLRKIIDITKEMQKTWLWLGVWQLNLNAVRFYERHGFKKFETHSFYIGNDQQTDWLMRLDLV